LSSHRRGIGAAEAIPRNQRDRLPIAPAARNAARATVFIHTGSAAFSFTVSAAKEQARSVESVAAIQERSLESARHLRDPAQQCYLLIGLTDDAQVTSHLLDLGLALERQVGLIEGGPPVARRRA